MTTPVDTRDPLHAAAKPARYVVALLFLVSAVSFMDRQILAILLEPIKRELGASDTEMGLLTGFAFVLFFALASIPIARAADRYSRRNIIAVALTFWSIMTMLSGYVATFVRRKLDQIDAVTRLEDLKVPPGNRLHALVGDLRGLHAVRVNDQYRITFRFKSADAFEVLCTDYH